VEVTWIRERSQKISYGLIFLLLLASLTYAFSFDRGPLKSLFYVVSFAACLILSFLRLRHPSIRKDLRFRLSQNKVVLSLVLLYIALIWLSALKTGVQPKLVNLIVSSTTLIFIHLFFPVITSQSKDVDRLIKAIVVIGMAAVAVSWLMYFGKVILNVDWGVILRRDLVLEKKDLLEKLGIPFAMKGPFVHSNYLGLLVALLVPCLLYILRTSKSLRIRRWVGISLGSCFFTLVTSLSVISAIPAALTALGFVFVRRPWFHQAIRVGAVVLILFFNLAVIARIDMQFMHRLPIRSDTRILLWNRAIELIHQGGEWGTNTTHAYQSMPFNMRAHNTIIDTALVNGIPAMIVYSLYLILILFVITPRSEVPLSLCVFYIVISTIAMQFFEYLPFGRVGVIMNFFFLITTVPYIFALKSSPADTN